MPVHSTTVLCIDVVAKTDIVDFNWPCLDEIRVKVNGGRITA